MTGQVVARRWHRRLVEFLVFGVLPAVLVLAILWTLVQLVSVSMAEAQAASSLQERRGAYEQTATALATYLGGAAVESNAQLVAQFVTNTPQAGQSDGVFATNTPMVTPAPPSATPQPDAQSAGPATPFVAPTFFPAPAAEIPMIAGTAVPTPVPLIARNYELVNIMLLGGDDELATDGSVRTDTMIIVSINTQTRTVSMLSLPRDLFVYIPTPTMARLNTVYGIGESFGWQGGGWGLLRETIFYNFGINVHYYIKANFTGFETIIDTLGGVEIAVDCAYEDYYPKAVIDPSLPVEQNYELRTLEPGYYRFDGFDALWYTRTRRVADDFDRGRRQQQMLRAIFRAARDQGLVNSVPQLWGEVTQVVETNVPFDVMLGLLPIAVDVDPAQIANYTMKRLYHTTPWQPSEGPYAGQFVQLPVYDTIQQLLTEFYLPPTSNRVVTTNARVVVYNGTGRDGMDRVAAEKLRDAGIVAIAAGSVDPVETTSVVDRVGDDKGSLTPAILTALNQRSGAAAVQPDPSRAEDYTIVLGADYNSCTANIVSPDQLGGA
jgi:LCP family protein required for cell wall assembly